jgi:HAD superfamily hydrolase (TIGR01509 family)
VRLPALPRDVRAVVFDMDGLLVDSERVFRDSMVEISRRLGRAFPLAVFRSMVGTPGEHGRRIAADYFGPDVDIDAWFTAVADHAHAQMDVDLAVKAGAIELLDALDRLALPRAVATSSSHASVRRQLGPLARRFDTVVAHGDYARGKPHPDPFLTAAERLGIEPEACLALEDSHNGVRAAHAAGLMTIMVPDLLDATDEMRGLCVAIAETLHDVRELLVAQRRA